MAMLRPDVSHGAGTDILTFAFESSTLKDETIPLYIDADNPDHYLNAVQVKVLVRKLISGLKAFGLQNGECVLVLLPNSFLYPAVYFSIVGAGGVYLGSNPASQVFELNHILKLCTPKFIITSEDLVDYVQQTSDAHKYPAERLFVLRSKTFPLSAASRLPASPPLSHDDTLVDEEAKEYTDIVALTQHGESDWARFQDESTAKATPAAMFLTSGTSGLPKAAVASHYAMVRQHLSMEDYPPYQVKRLISLPFFHLFASHFAHVFPIRLGQPLYILPRFNMDAYVNAVQQFNITDSVIAPPIVHAFNRSSLPLRECLNTIRWIGVGGAPIAAEGMQRFRRHLHEETTLSQVWGMTEIGVAMLVQYPEQDCDGSIGRPLPGYEVQLVDSFGGTVLSDDEPGELRVRYDGMMTGYKDQSPLENGSWYSTGDIMTKSRGKYYVVGRSKELIKVNGFQVPPAELEAVLMSHPCIDDAGVIGVLHENGDTEIPRAYVVRKSDSEGRCSTLSPEEIYDYTRERLASYKMLRGGIFFVDHIPRTASGKIQRFKLAQMDQYRRSVTELLVQSNPVVAEEKKEKVKDIKVRNEERCTGIRRSSRIASSQTGWPGALDLINMAKTSKVVKLRKRSRTSIVDKVKALEASRTVLGDDSMGLPPSGRRKYSM